MKLLQPGLARIILLDTTRALAMDSYLERLQAAIISTTDGMAIADLMRHSEGKWSTAEVLEHLYLSYTGTTRGCERCLQAGRPLARAPNLKDWLATSIVVGAGYFPRGREAPKHTRPRGMPAEKVVVDIGPQIAAMDALIAQCETRYGKRTRILDHPVLGPLTAAQWRKFHWVHGKHHVKQILRLRDKR
jgi:hypothetical protein